MKNLTQKFIGLLALVFVMSFTINAQEIGDIYEGGYIFQINEDGTGLVADLEDLSIINWFPAIDSAEVSISQGYNDWYLPNIEELELIYNTIGQGADNIGDFRNDFYWSSTVFDSNNNYAVGLYFNVGSIGPSDMNYAESVRVIRSVTFGKFFLDLPEGWSMFGYTCIDSVDAIVGFSSLSDKIEIVKDEWGLSYIPSWEFNAMGSLKFSEGYQIKMTEEVTDFQFCEAIVPEDGITQADVDAAVAEVHAMYDGWCESDVDNDGVCDIDEVSGCVESNACNYNANATDDDGSCAFAFAFFDCSGLCLNDDNDNNICDELEVFGCMNETYCNYNELANMDDGSCEGLLGCTVELFSEFNPDATCDDGSCEIVYVCMDEASPNYQPWVIQEAMMYGGFPTHDDSMCGQEGCMIEQGCNYDPSNEFGSTDLCEFPEEGFDCNGNIFNINELQIGDYYAGGIVYILNDDGTGWVVNPIQNTVWMSSGSYSEYINQANSNINNVTNGDYGDWQLAGYNDYVTLSELFGPLSSESPQFCNQDDYSWGFNDDNPNIMSDSDASFVFCNGDLQAPMWWYYPNVNYRLVRAF